MNPGNIFHSNSIGSPSIRFRSLRLRFSKCHLILFFQASTGWSLILPRQSTESATTQVLAFVIPIALSHGRVRLCEKAPDTSCPVSEVCGGHQCLLLLGRGELRDSKICDEGWCESDAAPTWCRLLQGVFTIATDLSSSCNTWLQQCAPQRRTSPSRIENISWSRVRCACIQT